MVDFQNIKILYRLWEIARTARRVYTMLFRRGNPISEEWLRERLLALKLPQEQLKDDEYVRSCQRALQFSGIFYEGQAEQFFKDKGARQDLESMYERQLERPASFGLDAFGYCFWGPRFHLVERADRDRMLEFLWDQMRRSPEGQQNRAARDLLS